MAKTITFGELITSISKKISRTTEEDFAAMICNMTIQEIWKRYDWRESLSEYAFWLAPGVQDYGYPLSVIPTNFDGLRSAQLIIMNGNPIQIVPIDTTKTLIETNIQAPPSSVCYVPERNVFRVFPTTPLSWGIPEYMISGTYKILPPRVTSSTFQGTVLPFDDKYFFCLMETALWKGYELNGNPMDEKAQLKSLTAIDEMARDQGLNDGDTSITPSGPLAWTTQSFGYATIWS